MKNNREFASADVSVAAGVEAALVDLFYDPQTLGGLLLSMGREDAERFWERFGKGRVVGPVRERGEFAIVVG